LTEENAEIYLNEVQGHVLPMAFVEPRGVPLFPAVYGGYFVGFGQIFMQVDFYPDPNVFAAKLTEMFLWGMIILLTRGNMLSTVKAPSCRSSTWLVQLGK